MMNSLSEQKIPKIMTLGISFQRFWSNTTKPQSFTTALLEAHDVIEYCKGANIRHEPVLGTDE